MKLTRDGSTNCALLKEVADWENRPAWFRFRDTYDPVLARWCRSYGLDRDSIDEVCQRIWIELADRMKTFEYDPNRTFRGWLRRLCESRVLNFLRQRRAACASQPRRTDRRFPEAIASRSCAIDPDGTDDGRPTDCSSSCRTQGEKAQTAVRLKVKPRHVGCVLAGRRLRLERRADCPLAGDDPYRGVRRPGSGGPDALRRRKASFGRLDGRTVMVIRAGKAGDHVVLPWRGNPTLARRRHPR